MKQSPQARDTHKTLSLKLEKPHWTYNYESFEFLYRNPEIITFQGDYFAMELVSGLLYVHISLAGDTVKFRASRSASLLSDGEWHKVRDSQLTLI